MFDLRLNAQYMFLLVGFFAFFPFRFCRVKLILKINSDSYKSNFRSSVRFIFKTHETFIPEIISILQTGAL